MNWYDLPVVRQLPLAHRLWAHYLRLGPKTRSGGTRGGSRLFSLLRRQRLAHPLGTQNRLRVQADLAPGSMVIDLTDFECFQHTLMVWHKGSAEHRLLARMLRPGDVFFDIGANYGLYALAAAALGGADTRVYAFEPQPRVAAALREAIAANGFANVELVEAAVADSEGRISFSVPETGSGIGSLSAAHASAQGAARQVEVALISLDAWARDRGLARADLMKIDVEGYEASVLRGARELLAACRPVIWFELNASALASAGSSAAAIFDALARAGYERFFEVESLAPYAPGTAARPGTVINIIAVTPDRLAYFEERMSPGARAR